MAASLTEILDIADRALALPSGSLEVIDLIEQYGQMFELFAAANPDLFSGKATADQKRLLELLEQRHIKLLEIADSLKDETSAQLRELKTKGKGLMAYSSFSSGAEGSGQRRKGRKG